jgi:hypothetical protein
MKNSVVILLSARRDIDHMHTARPGSHAAVKSNGLAAVRVLFRRIVQLGFGATTNRRGKRGFFVGFPLLARRVGIASTCRNARYELRWQDANATYPFPDRKLELPCP